MDELGIKLIRAFELKDASVRKDRGYYIVKTKNGGGLITKIQSESEHVLFQHEVKEYLYSNGINTDRFYLSAQKRPYHVLDGDIYVFTEVPGSMGEADYSDVQEFKRIVAAVSLMHKLLRHSGIKTPDVRQAQGRSYGEAYKKSLALLNRIRNRLSREGHLTDFDVLFIKNYEYYSEQLGEAIKLISNTKLNHYIREADAKGYITHNQLKEENILVNKDSICITNFTECDAGYYIYDLESLIRRYVRSLPQNHLTVGEIIEVYNTHNMLEKDEIRILYSLLKYPAKYLKICGQYYSKKRSFTPGVINARILTELQEKERYDTYISSLKSI